MLTSEFFQQDPVTCARELIGAEFSWDGCSGIIVETEAYAEHGDEACHTFFRPSARRFVEAHEAGAAYVYLNYGMYWLTNVLVKGKTNGFVLLRALEPREGVEAMRERRKKERLTDLCSGPGKLSMALGLHGDHHGTSLVDQASRGFRTGSAGIEVRSDLRIGISVAQDLPWRFLAAESPHISVQPKQA